MDGLGQVLLVKSKSVLPYLIPQLIAPPPNTSALAILSTVAGDAMSRHVSKILPCLISVLNETAGTSKEQQVKLDFFVCHSKENRTKYWFGTSFSNQICLTSRNWTIVKKYCCPLMMNMVCDF